ncbi:MAG: hypothetical protein ACLVHV_14945 [Oscillospiraceae bacterium]
MLIQGTQTHPDLQSISRALDGLYGASLGPLVRKNGQIQTWGFARAFWRTGLPWRTTGCWSR